MKEFFKYFAMILLGITAISIVAEFFDKVSELYSKQVPLSLIFQYLLLQAPRVMLYAMPFTMLFSILITIGIASKWREIVVIKASGSSTRRLFSSFLIVGLIISLGALILGETVIPESTRKASWLRKVKILKRSPSLFQREQALWMKGLDKSLIRVDGFVSDENRILKTSIFSFDPSFRLEKRVEAEEAEWVNGAWNLKEVTVYDFNDNSIQKLNSLSTQALEEPRIFKEDVKKPKEMNFTELYTYYSRLEKAGFKNLKYMIRLYEKLSYPSINFIMLLFGLALALNTKWGGGIRSAGLGVLVSVCYWLIYSVSISLGTAGVLPPWIAPWIGPVIFGIAGGTMYLKITD